MKIIIMSKSNLFEPIEFIRDHNVETPRVGDRIDVGFAPAPKIIDILWSKYLTSITIFTE